MMKNLLQIVCLCLSVSFVNAQNKWNSSAANSWVYDLTGDRNPTLVAQNELVSTKPAGTNSVFTPGGSATPSSTSTTPGWLPAPTTTGEVVTVQKRATTNTISTYTLVKEDNVIKSLKIDATNAWNKFIIRSIDNNKATPIAKYSFTLKTHYKDGDGNTVNPGYIRTYDLVFGSNTTGTGTSGEGSIFRSGQQLTENNILGLNQAVFTSFQLKYQAGSPTMSFSHRKILTRHNNGTDGIAEYNTISDANAVFNADGSAYTIELYCNNDAVSQYYVVNSTIYTVVSQTAHLWLNGNKIGEYSIANTGQSLIDAEKTLDAFMIYTTGGTGGTGSEELGYGSVEFSNFKVDYVSTTSDTPLPVSLAAFTGNYNSNTVKLSWKTLSEKDNSHFEILRSGDGITFNEIARVSGAGNSTEVVNYTTTDYSPLAGVNYYQLKQVDNNGKYTLSDAIAVNTSLSDNALKVIKKEGALGVTLYSTNSSIYNVYVTHINGRRLYSQKVQVSAGNNQFDIAIPSLIAGVYVLSLESDSGVQSVKFVN